MESPLYVINHQYCFPYNINLKVDRDNGTTYKDNYKHFNVKKLSPTLHHRHVLQDAAGNTIVTLYKKKMSMHKRWEVYKGENGDSNNLLFSVKELSMLQEKIKLDVFLANNSTGEVCDFKIKATEKSCVIFAGKDERIIAEIFIPPAGRPPMLPIGLAILCNMGLHAQWSQYALERMSLVCALFSEICQII
ncbi:hypothetical protein L6164_000156 [Bauhinia variegata]|uniref:Uncharacterized protein n=1 Tax=Bauhinia variegata TaxID=167791 RepID=A0ACB9Q743_BAUVA|nr:hypothetical protein L6164_000156 [Bauhinia variegata]